MDRPQPWVDILRQVDQGIDRMLRYCEENQDWKKAFEANKLLQSKLASFSVILDRFATKSVDDGEFVAFKTLEASALPISDEMTIAQVFPMKVEIQPTTPTRKQSEDVIEFKLGFPQRSTSTNTKLRHDAPTFQPTKRDDPFGGMKSSSSTGDQTGKVVRRTLTTGSLLSSSREGRVSSASTSTVIANSNAIGGGAITAVAATASTNTGGSESKPSSTSAFSTNTNTAAANNLRANRLKVNTKPKAKTDKPKPLPQPEEEKDDEDQWEEKVRAEMQAATEQIWQVTEAWVDAEAEVEDLEWRILEMGINRLVGLTDQPIDLDEIGPGKLSKKLSARKDKLLLDTSFMHILGSNQDHNNNMSWLPRDYRSSPDKQARYSTPIKTEDNYSSPSTGKTTQLQSKLASPDRTRRSLTPTEALKKLEAKQQAAEINRNQSVSEKVQKAQLASIRVRLRNEKEAERLSHAGESLRSKQTKAEQRHADYISLIKGRAESENAKVIEVLTNNALTSDAVAAQLQQKLEEVEAKILAANLRREQRLAGISGSQRRKNTKKALQMSEFRLFLEKLKMERWEKLQKRIEAVAERRRVRIAELKRRAEDNTIDEEGTTQSQDPNDHADHNTSSPNTNADNTPGSNSTSHKITPMSPDRGTEDNVSVSGLFPQSTGEKLLLHDTSHDDHDEEDTMLLKLAVDIGYRLFVESIHRPKIAALRTNAWDVALQGLQYSPGLYSHFVSNDSSTNEVEKKLSLKIILERLVQDHRSNHKDHHEEREASSFHLYTSLMTDLSSALASSSSVAVADDSTVADNSHSLVVEALEKINFLVLAALDDHHSATATAVAANSNTSGGIGSNRAKEFGLSGGLLLLTVLFSHECGLLSEPAMNMSTFPWLLSEEPIEAVAIVKFIQLVITSLSHDSSAYAVVGFSLSSGVQLVLSELLLSLSLILYKGGCELLSFKACSIPAGQRLQSLLAEVMSAWVIGLESYLVSACCTAKEAQVDGHDWMLFFSDYYFYFHSRYDNQQHSKQSNELDNNCEAALQSLFRFSFLCQDLNNFFSSIHIAVLSTHCSLEEAFLSTASKSTMTVNVTQISKAIINEAFINLMHRTASYAKALAMFVRWAKDSRRNSSFHTLSRHWWSLMRKASTLPCLLAILSLSVQYLYVLLLQPSECKDGGVDCMTVLAVIHWLVETIKATISMVLTDEDFFKQLSHEQKTRLLFMLHVLLMLMTKSLDHGKEGLSDPRLSSALHSHNEQELSTYKMECELCFEEVLLLLMVLSQRDIDVRRAIGSYETRLEDGGSKLEEAMRNILVPITATTNQQQQQSVDHGLLSALCQLPIRYYKDSRIKHVLCPCLIAICLELEQHFFVVKQCGRDKYVRKFVEYITAKTIAAKASIVKVDKDDRKDEGLEYEREAEEEEVGEQKEIQSSFVMQQQRYRRSFSLISDSLWLTIVQGAWLTETVEEKYNKE